MSCPVKNLALVIALFGSLVACGDGIRNQQGQGATADGGGNGEFGNLDGFTGSDLNTGNLDVPGLDTAPSACEFPADPKAGQPGAPCTEAKDCDSNYCVQAPQGQICTQKCEQCCPSGFACIQNLTGGDSAFICQPKSMALCWPCQSDADCGAQAQGALCLDYPGHGRFCGGSCANAEDCPQGYACESANGTQGGGKQCVRKDGQCGCSEKASQVGAQASCSVSNNFGSCGGTRTCGASGLSNCSASTPAGEDCNGKDDDCDGLTDEELADLDQDKEPDCTDPDDDGDGTNDEQDCAPKDKNIHPGAQEDCNGKDDDCDGLTDEGQLDTDGDGKADCIDTDDDNDGVPDPQDCDPLDKKISPKAVELCDGVDNDCNGKTDEGYADANGNGVADCVDGDQDGDGVANDKDCAPKDPKVFPGATEKCNGKDDDCDSAIDEPDALGCSTWYQDADGDGAGGPASKCLCAPDKSWPSPKTGDCDDTNPLVGPGQAEVCANGKDDDCDGGVDEPDGTKGCSSFWTDADKDSWGTGAPKCQCGPSGVYSATKTGDCNDQSPVQAPGATELCNGKDDDCDSQTDEIGAQGCTQYYSDKDGDGYGNSSSGACTCGPVAGYPVQIGGDCNDQDKTKAPGAQEKCNGVDDDCDGQVDEENATGCKAWYLDADGDGFGSSSSKCLCGPGGDNTSSNSSDCNDNLASTKPGAAELCNGQDDNCAGGIDEGFVLGAVCTAGTGACKVTGQIVCSLDGKATACSAQAGGTTTEACNDLDDDCDGVTDDGCDDDNDDYCDASKAWTGSKTCPKGKGDCSDSDATRNPGAVETCNGKDDNCDGKTDGMTQACSSACGAGTQVCSAGTWGTCSATAPQCTSGPCCDGCKFKPATTLCGSAPVSTSQTCSGSCGGGILLTENWAYCTGSSSTCGTGNVKPVAKGLVQTCGANQLCSTSGSSASCSTCTNGCANGACKSQPITTVCIDPGYGGYETGASNGALIEKTLTLSFANHLKSWLDLDSADPTGGGNWKVVMTRTSDVYVPLATRAATCNAAASNRVISIFVNDIKNDTTVNGVESYIVPGYSAATLTYSKNITNRIATLGGLSNRGVKTGSYTILVQTDASATLTLPGFIHNPGDAAKLGSDAWRKTIGLAILQGLQQTYGYATYTPK
jgi:N-acetylmuramoyl-L-alanine amidase